MQQPQTSTTINNKIDNTQWLQNTTNKARFQVVYFVAILLALALISVLQAAPLQCQLRKNTTETITKNYNPQTTTKALELITKSILTIENSRSSNAEAINLKEIAKIDSALSMLYLLQLFSISNTTMNGDKDKYGIICPTCKQFWQGNFSFVLHIPFDSNIEAQKDKVDIADKDIKTLLELDLAAKVGEELLCVGLEKKDTKILLESYANFALAGVNARAVNVLLSAVQMGDKDGVIILGFLLDNGIYLNQNKVASQMITKAIDSGNLGSVFANLVERKNFVVSEFDTYSNVLENVFYQQLITLGIIINEQDNRYESLNQKQKADMLTHIQIQSQKVKSSKQAIIDKMNIDEKRQFNEALKFKQHLHNTDEYPFASVFVLK